MKNLLYLLLVSLSIKLLYILSVYVANMGHSAKIPMNNTHDVVSLFKKNDSWWYEKVAVNGHEHITPQQLGKCEDKNIQQSYYAFFPLYPAIIGVTMHLLHFSFNFAAFAYSLLFSFLLFSMFYVFVKNYFASEKVAFFATLLLIVFPFNYYFSAFLTEALFLLLLVLSFYLIDKKQKIAFAISASLLVWVRPNGLFMLVPLFIYYLEKEFALTAFAKGVTLSGIKKYAVAFVTLTFNHIRKHLVFAVPLLAFVAYCTYLKWMTGDFFAYKTAQAGWCRETVFPWVPIVRCKSPMDYFNAAYLIFFAALACMWFRKIPLSFIFLIWISILLPLIANTITSPRFISVLFIFPMFLGKLLSEKKASFQVIVLLALTLIQLYTFTMWLSGGEESYLL